MAGSFRHANNTVPAHTAINVTPSDTTHLQVTRGLYVGSTGNLNVLFTESGLDASATAGQAQAAAIVLYNVAAGTILPVQVVRVLSTSTTASNIVALY